MKRNCRNCGARWHANECDYCGTVWDVPMHRVDSTPYTATGAMLRAQQMRAMSPFELQEYRGLSLSAMQNCVYDPRYINPYDLQNSVIPVHGLPAKTSILSVFGNLL